MKKIIFVLLILLIIIFIYILLLKKEKYKNKEITNLKNVILYGNEIDINTNKNQFDVDNICIYTNDNNKQCLDLTVPKNKELPRQKGSDGICNDDDCFECSCPNGLPADKDSITPCNKKRSDTDKVQCKACNIGYTLSNVSVPGSQFSKRSCLPCTVSNNLFQDQSLHTGGCGLCGVSFSCPDTHKLVGCGFKSRGRCEKNICKCTNGKAMEECGNEEDQFCKSCSAGYYRRVLADGTIECAAVELGKQWQPNEDHVGGARVCTSCPHGESYKSRSCTATTDAECTPCNKSACPRNTYELSRSCNNIQNGPTCPGCKSAYCRMGEYAESYTCRDGPKCKEKRCICPGGTGTKGTACPVNNGYKCANCVGSHSLVGGWCYKNEITVYEESGYEGASRTFSGAPGTAIKLKEMTMRGNTNWKDEISSFKKHSKAKIHFHGRDNDWPNSGGDWADLYNVGDKLYVGGSWQNAVDVISFGQIPYKWRRNGKEDRIR